MPADRGLTGTAARGDAPAAAEPPLDRRAAREAAVWLMRLRSEDATDAEREACQRWRAAHPEHERAWQRAEALNRRFGLIPPAIGLRTLDRAGAGAAPRRAGRSRRAGLKTLALLATAAPAGWVAWRATPWRDVLADERTAIGERRRIVLADGTRVHLDTATAIDIRFDAEQRLLVLAAGEVLIETAADPLAAQGAGRPFLVQTAEGRLRALGTRFTVRQQAGTTQVRVLEGAVELRPRAVPQAPQIVHAGRQARFGAEAVGTIEALSPNADAWSRGVLFASRMRLADFAAELGRYRPGLLRCEPAVTELRISGAFQLADTDAVLSALAATLPVAVVYRTRYWVTLAAPG